MKLRTVAEIAQAHDGSLGIAHSYIDVLSRHNVTDIKFQMHFAEEESSQFDSFRVDIFPQDISRYNYWKRIAFSEAQWEGLKKHCDENGVNMIVSPFSDYAVDVCKRIGITSVKIGSGEMFNDSLIAKCAQEFPELILSSGMSSWADLDRALSLQTIRFNKSLYLLHCTSQYPTPLESVGLNNIEMLACRYRCKTGLSDHSGRLAPIIMAVAQGYTQMVEFHVTFSRDCFGPDASSSIELSELALLMDLLRDIEVLTLNKTSKDAVSSGLQKTRDLFTKSIFTRRELHPGCITSIEDFVMKKPGIFISQDRLSSFIGRTVVNFITAGQPVKEEDFE